MQKHTREISLDTETTGFSFQTGDRIVEIGCVEMENMMPTGEVFHVYINPERSVPQEAINVHGLDDNFLKDKPLFKDVADDFLKFIGDSDLVIHNAPFDMKFLDGELQRLGKPALSNTVHDTLTIARRKYPNKQSSLDALCNFFKIDKTKRDLHGALIDASLLSEVYLELMGGRNYHLSLDKEKPAKVSTTDRIKKISSSSDVDDVDAALIFKPAETELLDNTAFRQKHGFT